MKRIVIVGILLAISLAVAPFVSAETWYGSDERATIDIISMTGDFDESTTIQGSVEGMTFSDNETLPLILDEFDDTATKYAMYADGDAIEYDLVVNGVAIASGVSVADGDWDNKTLADIIGAGVDENDYWLDVEITVNNSDWDMYVYWVGDDSAFRSAWIATAVDITEMDNSTPSVEGIWVVIDNMTFDLDFDLTDVDLNIDYPGIAVSETSGWENDSALSDGDSVLVTYQKYGPVHEIDEDDVTATAGSVTVTFESDDELDDAIWEIDFDDEIWDGAFDDIDEDTLTIEINDDVVDEDDWEMGSLTIENVDIKDGDNEAIFTWTSAAPGAPGAPEAPLEPIWEQEAIQGVPNWALMAIIAVIIIAILAVVATEKKR